MGNLAFSGAVGVMLLVAPEARAADDFIKGVYLASDALCAQAKKDTLDSVIEAGNVMLTAHGLEGIEFNCQFLQVAKSRSSPGWLVSALCEVPDYMFPDVLSIRQMSATQVDLVSVKPDDKDADGGGNSGSYFLCEGVAEP